MKKLGFLLLLTALVWAAGFAPDQRHLVPAQPPFTALGRTSAHGGVGCGVLIAPDLLLTCAHCVSNPQRQVYDDVEVEFGLGFYPTTHRARLSEAYMAQNATSEIDAGQDWAIVRLDRPLGLYYGWLNCQYLSDSEWPEAEVELLGYCGCPEEARPQFGHMDRPYRCPGAVSDVGPQIVFHNCAMWGGTSGAPLLARTDSGYRLVGLNFAGVSLEDEVLQHGFRDTYTKRLANLAIPARNWRSQLEQLSSAPVLPLRTVWVKNRSKRSLRVSATYRSIFSEPDSPPARTELLQVPPRAQRVLLTREQGCADAELSLQVDDKQPMRKALNTTVTILNLP